jgi:hypothetical protein
MLRIVFWDILPCKMIVDRRFRGVYCLHHQYIPEDNSEHHTRRRENLKSHNIKLSHNFKALLIVQTISSQKSYFQKKLTILTILRRASICKFSNNIVAKKQK